MFPDLEFIKTMLNGLRSRIEKVENWVVSFVRVNRSNWAQNDPDALDYIKGRTHYEVNGRVVQLPSKFLPSPTSNAVGAIKADSAKTTDIQPVRLGTDGKLYSSGIPIFTTSGTGSAYTANVLEINELVNGMLVVMIPHAASGSTSPTLNINGLGAHQIRRFKSSGSSNNYSASYTNWLYPGVPVLIVYSSGYWSVCNLTKPDASDLLGQVSALHGGTGVSFLKQGSYLVGNGTGKVLQKTPPEVLADIGAIPVPATASVGQVLVVKAVDDSGKPTEWEAADMPSGGGPSGGGHWETVLDTVWEQDVVNPTAFNSETGIFTCASGELNNLALNTEYVFFQQCAVEGAAYDTILNNENLKLTKLSDTTFSIDVTPPTTFVPTNVKFSKSACLVITDIDAKKIRLTLDGQFRPTATLYDNPFYGMDVPYFGRNTGYTQIRNAYQAYQQVTAEVESPYRIVGEILCGFNAPSQNGNFHFKNNSFCCPLIPYDVPEGAPRNYFLTSDGTKIAKLYSTKYPWHLGGANDSLAIINDYLKIISGTKVKLERWVE